MKRLKLSDKYKFVYGFVPAMLFFFGLIVQAPEHSQAFIARIETSIEESDANLQAKSDALLPLFGEMAAVPVYLNDESIIKQGSNTERGVAYTRCESQTKPAIFIKRGFYDVTNEKQLTNILKHELTHAWLCRQGLMSGHDENFRRKFAEVGGFGN